VTSYLLSALDRRNALVALGAVDHTIGATTFKGTVRDPDQALYDQDPQLFANAKVVMAVTEDLPATVASGAAITVGGDSMKVHAVQGVYDGSMTRLVVKVA